MNTEQQVEQIVNEKNTGNNKLTYSHTSENSGLWCLEIQDLHEECDGIVIINSDVNITKELVFEDGEDSEYATVYTDDDLNVNCVVYSID